MSERRAIRRRAAALAVGLAVCTVNLAVLVACGGGGKQASAPGNCPEGTVLNGSDCLPSGTASRAGQASEETSSSSSDSTSSRSGSTAAQSSDVPSTAQPSGSTVVGGKSAYDKDSVEIELKRAARQVKANCGSATDDNGTAPGPWGKTTVSVTLGRNGHVKDVSVPAPFDGQPGGTCAANAFKKIQFPPYASSSDVVVPWDVELVKPRH